jgi:hypothetical protein
VETVAVDVGTVRAKVIDTLVAEASEVPLTEATIIVSGGRSVKGPKGFVPIRALAKALGAFGGRFARGGGRRLDRPQPSGGPKLTAKPGFGFGKLNPADTAFGLLNRRFGSQPRNSCIWPLRRGANLRFA